MRTIVSLLVLLPLITILSCKETPGPTGPQGPAGPPGSNITGTLAGRARLTTLSGSQIRSDSILVVLEPAIADSAFSDSAGAWKLSSVPTGTYTIVFSKTGYFQTRLYNQQFVGAGTFYTPTILLPPTPNNLVSDLAVTGPDYQSTFHFQGNIARPDSFQDVLIFLSKHPIVNPNSFDYSIHLRALVDVTGFGTSLTFSPTFCNYYDLDSGMVLYYTAAPVSYGYIQMQRIYGPNPATGEYQFRSTQPPSSVTGEIIVP
jgi:hypothetical protein